jgi:hypothetical protein
MGGQLQVAAAGATAGLLPPRRDFPNVRKVRNTENICRDYLHFKK